MISAPESSRKLRAFHCARRLEASNTAGILRTYLQDVLDLPPYFNSTRKAVRPDGGRTIGWRTRAPARSPVSVRRTDFG
jgi:hypothetical protein